VDDPSELRYERTFQWDSSETAEGLAPTVYVFLKNEIPYIQNLGTSELTIRASFDPDPEWLDDAYETSSEVKDGLCLESRER
jgi:hypothetical protein